jgi:hypothetical protein
MIEVSRVGFGMLVKMLFDIGARIWNWPVIDRLLTVAEHFLDVLIIRLKPISLQWDSICLWPLHVKCQPLQTCCLLNVSNLFLVKVDWLRVCYQHHLLSLKISTSSLVTDTELKFCPSAGCKKNVNDLVLHVVKCVVNAKVESFGAPELSRILVRSNHSRLPFIKSIELKPVFVSAMLDLNREEKSAQTLLLV